METHSMSDRGNWTYGVGCNSPIFP